MWPFPSPSGAGIASGTQGKGHDDKCGDSCLNLSLGSFEVCASD